MGDEAEFRDAQVRIARLDDNGMPGETFPVRAVELRVVPPDDDEYVAVRAVDLVGKTMTRTDTLGKATARLDGGFVVIEYEDGPSYHRTLIRADAWVLVKRRVGEA